MVSGTVNKSKSLSNDVSKTKLTPEQEAKIQAYSEKWKKIGTSCEPCNFEKCKEFAVLTYQQADLEPPTEFYLCDSPIQAANLAADLKIKKGAIDVNNPNFNRKELVKECYDEQIYGFHEASWLAYYDFMLNEMGVEEARKLTGLMGMAENCGWWAPYASVSIFQHRPVICKFDENEKLHCEDGPAVLYQDGTSIYMIHGKKVEEKDLTK
jgi:hypothetical protein